MTNDELEAVRARAEAAHPGPWTHGKPTSWIWGPSEKGGVTHVADIRGWGYLTGHGHGALALSEDEALARQAATGAFIAHARTDIPALLDEVERKRDFARTQGDILHHTAELREIAEARATRAEAEVERLQHDVDRARGAQGELLAHAEMLGAAISWLDKPFVDADTSEAEIRKRIEFMLADYRQALSAYRGEMK